MVCSQCLDLQVPEPGRARVRGGRGISEGLLPARPDLIIERLDRKLLDDVLADWIAKGWAVTAGEVQDQRDGE